MGGSGDKRAFETMEKLCERKPVSVISFRQDELNKDYSHKLSKFVDIIKKEGAIKHESKEECGCN